MIAWLFAAVVGVMSAQAATSGWRGDGTALALSATPAAVDPAAAKWRVNTSAPGNGSPVLMGNLVCYTAEPTTLSCHDAESGALRWSRTNDWLDTLPAERRAEGQARLAAGDQANEALKAATAEYGQLQRLARSADSPPDTFDKIRALEQRLSALRQAVDATSAYRTPPRKTLGWASATPITDGKYIYTLMSQGVVSRFDAAGARQWSIWLGPLTHTMRGYHEGTTASPLLIGSTLVIPYNALHGIDASTGRLLWSTGIYDDYGTPTIATVGGRPYVVTPSGSIIDPSTGAVVGAHAGSVFYTSPTAAGDTLYYLGSEDDHSTSVIGGARASAVRLVPSGGGVQAQPLWTVTLPARERVYSVPVVHQGIVYGITIRRTLFALDAGSGRVLYQQSLDAWSRGETWTNLTIAGDRVVVVADDGTVVQVRIGPTFELVGHATLTDTVATPLFSRTQSWFRTNRYLYAFDG